MRFLYFQFFFSPLQYPKSLKNVSGFSLIWLRSKLREITHGNGFQGLRKEFLELSNSPTCFSWLCIFLAFGQIWLRSAKSVLSCNSWKCLLQVKSKVWENNAWKEFSLHKQVIAPYFKIFTYSKVKLKAIVFFYLSFVNASSTTKYMVFEVREREGFKTIERPFVRLSQRVINSVAIRCQSK